MNFRSGGGGVSKLSDSTDCAAKSNSCKLHSLFNIKEEELWMFVFSTLDLNGSFGVENAFNASGKKAKVKKNWIFVLPCRLDFTAG